MRLKIGKVGEKRNSPAVVVEQHRHLLLAPSRRQDYQVVQRLAWCPQAVIAEKREHRVEIQHQVQGFDDIGATDAARTSLDNPPAPCELFAA